MTVRVLVTGGRGYPNRGAVAAALAHIATLFPDAVPADFVLVHGDCECRREDGSIDPDRSADQLAAQEAAGRGWRCEPHPVDWEAIPARHWSRAGRSRNERMVGLGAAVCVAFPGGGGTRHCTNAARAAGIPVLTLADIPS
jgi:hypothetical protein